MVSVIHIADNIHVFYSKKFNIGHYAGEPYLLFSSICNINGEIASDEIVRSIHKFSECSPSSLRDLIEKKEPIPLDTMIDPYYAEILRERISNTITKLVCDCDGGEGLKMLHAVVLIEINLEEDDYVYMELDDVELLHDRRMNSLQKNIKENVTMAEKKDEICAICLHKMRVKEEVACTPCIHIFHHICISSWFEKSGFCPLCRFNIDSF